MLPIGDVDLKRSTTPYVTYGLIGLNALVFLYELFMGRSLFGTDSLEVTQFFAQYGVRPFEITNGHDLDIVTVATLPDGRALVLSGVASPVPIWATMFTSMFIHGGWMHVLGNMLFLWVFGDNIEDRFGHVKFLLFYLVAGLAAVGAQVAINPDSQTPMIGASGAISGVTGAYLVLFPMSRIRTLLMFGFIMVVYLPAVLVLGAWFVLQAFQGVGSLGTVGGGVAYWAHVGGFVLGMMVATGYKLVRRESLWPGRRRNPWDNFPPGYRDYR